MTSDASPRARRRKRAQCLVVVAAILVALPSTLMAASASTGNGPSLAQPWVIVEEGHQAASAGHGAVSSEVAYRMEEPAAAAALPPGMRVLRTF